MYSFAQRADTRVVDEPLYAHYLRRSGVDHPGRDEVLAAQDSDGERVVRDVILGACDRPVLFQKHMAHHLNGLERSFLDRARNVLLVRDPRDMLPSLARITGRPGLADTGLAEQVELLEQRRAAGEDPPVLDARELLLDPPGVLEQLCARLEIDFDPGMLSWEAGGRAEDGVWARHWYEGVHLSTGFQPYRPKSGELAPELRGVYEECRPCYERLHHAAIKAATTTES